MPPTDKPIRVFYGRITGTFYATQHWEETIENGVREFHCTGPTRVAAIMDAVQKARAAQEGAQ